MEDVRIRELDDAAFAYAEVRDQRQQNLREEVSLKETMRQAMHRYDRKFYRHGGTEIRLVQGTEDVRVKITKQAEVLFDEPVKEDTDAGGETEGA